MTTTRTRRQRVTEAAEAVLRASRCPLSVVEVAARCRWPTGEVFRALRGLEHSGRAFSARLPGCDNRRWSISPDLR